MPVGVTETHTQSRKRKKEEGERKTDKKNKVSEKREREKEHKDGQKQGEKAFACVCFEWQKQQQTENSNNDKSMEGCDLAVVGFEGIIQRKVRKGDAEVWLGTGKPLITTTIFNLRSTFAKKQGSHKHKKGRRRISVQDLLLLLSSPPSK